MANASQGIKGYLDAKERGDAFEMEQRKQEVNEWIAHQNVVLQRQQLLQGQQQFQETMGQRKAEFAHEQRMEEPLHEERVLDAQLRAKLDAALTASAKAKLGMEKTQSELDELRAANRRKALSLPGVGGRTLGEERDLSQIRSETEQAKAAQLSAEEFKAGEGLRNAQRERDIAQAESELEILPEVTEATRAQLKASIQESLLAASTAEQRIALLPQQFQLLQMDTTALLNRAKEKGISLSMEGQLAEIAYKEALTAGVASEADYRGKLLSFRTSELELAKQSRASRDMLSILEANMRLASLQFNIAQTGLMHAADRASLQEAGGYLSLAARNKDQSELKITAANVYNLWGTFGVTPEMLDFDTIKDVKIPTTLKQTGIDKLEEMQTVNVDEVSKSITQISDTLDNWKSEAETRLGLLQQGGDIESLLSTTRDITLTNGATATLDLVGVIRMKDRIDKATFNKIWDYIRQAYGEAIENQLWKEANARAAE
jgi:hypothetical protein